MTAPLVPADVDLRGMQFIPLDTVRLLDSDLFALSTGDEFKAAVALWCKAWLQVPAASLPNDERVLAHLSGAGTRWRKVRHVALRGFVACDDGRLYHPVIVEKALEAWEHRKAQRAKAAKRWPGKATGDAAAQPAAQPAGDTAAHAPAIQGTGTGTGTVKGQENHQGAIAPLSGKPDAKAQTASKRTAEAKAILAFLNERAGRNFPPTDTNVGIIVARMKEGFTAVQIRQVVASRIRHWKGNDKMEEYLRPETLFNRTKFSSYVGELVDIPDDEAVA